MAYRRRGERISKAKKLKAQSREKARIQRGLDQIQIAQQAEARKRAKSKGKGMLGGGLLAWAIPAITGPAGYALMMAAGKALGDVAYVTGHGGGRKTSIEKATDALRKLERGAMFAETRAGAQRGIVEGEIAQETISEGDLETGTLDFAKDAITNYITAVSLGKSMGAKGESAAKGFKGIEEKLKAPQSGDYGDFFEGFVQKFQK